MEEAPQVTVESALTSYLLTGFVSDEELALLKAQDPSELGPQARTLQSVLNRTAESPQGIENRAAIIGRLPTNTLLWGQVELTPVAVQERGSSNASFSGPNSGLGRTISGRRTLPHRSNFS